MFDPTYLSIKNIALVTGASGDCYYLQELYFIEKTTFL